MLRTVTLNHPEINADVEKKNGKKLNMDVLLALQLLCILQPPVGQTNEQQTGREGGERKFHSSTLCCIYECPEFS